jgi:hypothetical protein
MSIAYQSLAHRIVPSALLGRSRGNDRYRISHAKVIAPTERVDGGG